MFMLCLFPIKIFKTFWIVSYFLWHPTENWKMPFIPSFCQLWLPSLHLLLYLIVFLVTLKMIKVFLQFYIFKCPFLIIYDISIINHIGFTFTFLYLSHMGMKCVIHLYRNKINLIYALCLLLTTFPPNLFCCY